MAIFSDLPNELIMGIWGYVIEPDDIESFALVSKRIYHLSSHFVNEHASLKQQYSRVRFSYTTGNYGPADLLEKILLDTRIVHYINNLEISAWETPWKEQTIPQEHTMALFEEAIRASPLITSSETEDWIRDVKKGKGNPIIALVMMRLTKINGFALWRSERDEFGYLLRTLKRITQSSEVAIEPRQSIPGTEIHGDNQISSTRPSIFSTTSDMRIDSVDITFDTISQLLRCTKGLKSFIFQRSFGPSFEVSRLCEELLECSQLSLQKLSIGVHGEEMGLGDITQFQILAKVEMYFEILLGDPYGTCKNLADVLPVSIESVAISTAGNPIPNQILGRLIFDMTKCKMERLPKFQELTFVSEMYQAEATTPDIELITELQDMSAKVGVLLRIY
ncbi:hypothetical protein IMSHALPRED_009956 [Imshaugia aleurites]|uniref:F-box domain-containing protein n=1 Tax=Imshaugia aleurites TaxID=172621 RepID=A0A8H3ES25_9LECA|nr:hypothetical protein IMSHALPRED_009956 [Imshaugia aleurites]